MNTDDPRYHDGGLTTGQRIGLLETSVLRHAERIDHLEGWRDELRGAMYLVKFTMGTSILSAIIAMIALVTIITGGRP